MVIENGNVYLGAPDHYLLILESHMMLGRGPRENMVRPAIDPLFRSAALHYGSRVIGVVLSGLLSDGAAGLSAIKRCGGVALVRAGSTRPCASSRSAPLAGGYDTKEAERLVVLFKQTLVEWERHPRLIEQRVAYLQTCPFG